MPPTRLWITLLAALPLMSACAAFGHRSDDLGGPPLRDAVDVPAAFVTESGTNPTTGCRSPLVDPRDDTTIRMIRSGADRGDYEVPDGRYGVGPGEVLRIHCPTGVAIGVARR